MNYYVPDFDMPDDQLLIPSSSTFTHHKEDEDEISELLWGDGQIVVQNHNQHRKFQSSTTATPVQNQFNNYQSSQQQQELHMAEDEMTTWLHYPIEDVYSDLTENQQTTNSLVRQSTVIPPPIPPPSTVALPQQPPMEIVANQNFQMFSRMRGKGPEATVVESNSITAQAAVMSAGEASSVFPSGFGDGNGNDKGRIMDRGGGSGEMTLSSSSGTSGGGWPANTCTAAAAALNTAALEEGGEKVEDRKRKQREIDRSTTAPPTSAAYQDVELDAANNTKKRPRGFHSKKTRAAEVHNLSERRRRDRINERMRALQELVPRCNKTDKASMLDEVIEYLKSLQMQVQMMSMGGGMVPMMYPGMQQQCMPPIMGMGIGMRMNRPMMPFPSNMPGSNFPASPAVGAGPQVGPNFNNQPVCMPSVPVAANYSANQGDSVRGSYPVQQTPGLAQHPNLGDPYQHYMALQQMQMQMQMQLQMQMQMQAVQNQSTSYRGSSKTGTEGQPGPSTSKTEGEDDQ